MSPEPTDVITSKNYHSIRMHGQPNIKLLRLQLPFRIFKINSANVAQLCKKEVSVACSKNSNPFTKLMSSVEVIDGNLINSKYRKNNKTIYLSWCFPRDIRCMQLRQISSHYIGIMSLDMNRILTGVLITNCHHTCLPRAALEQVTEGQLERQRVELLRSVFCSVLCALGR